MWFRLRGLEFYIFPLCVLSLDAVGSVSQDCSDDVALDYISQVELQVVVCGWFAGNLIRRF